MSNENLQPFLDRYDKLPPEIKEAIFSAATADKVFDIGKKYNFLIDKMGVLSSEIGLLMIGVTHPRDFVSDLSANLKISLADAKKIAHDVNEAILMPIHDKLREIHNMAAGEKISFEEGPGMVPTPTSSTVPSRSIGAAAKPSSFEDLKTELQSMIERDERSVENSTPIKIKTQTPPRQDSGQAPVPPNPPSTSSGQAAYKTIDPYREPIDETNPKAQGKESAPPKTQNLKPETPAGKFSFGVPPALQTPPREPTPNPYRSGVLQKHEARNMEHKTNDKRPEPVTPQPPQQNSEQVPTFKSTSPTFTTPSDKDSGKPPEGHLNTPTGFRGFRMKPEENLSHLREIKDANHESGIMNQGTKTPVAPKPLLPAIPRQNSGQAPDVLKKDLSNAPVATPPSEQEIAKKEAEKPISQLSRSDPYREPLP